MRPGRMGPGGFLFALAVLLLTAAPSPGGEAGVAVVQEPGIPRPNGAPAHPHLFFAKDDLPWIRERVARAPFKRFYDAYRQTAQQALGPNSALNRCAAALREGGKPASEAEKKTLQDALGALVPLCFVHAVSGEEAYREPLRGFFDAVAGYEKKTGEDLNLDEAGPLVYDWAYDALSEEARQMFRRKFIAGCERAVRGLARKDREFVGWEVYNLMNGEPLFANFALAMFGEPGYRDEWLRLAALKWDTWLAEGFGADGDYNECPGYLGYGLEFGSTFADAALRKGVRFPHLERLRKAWEWIAWNTIPGGGGASQFGDAGGQFGGVGVPASCLASKYWPDDFAVRYAHDDEFRRPWFKPGQEWQYLLWYKELKPPAPEEIAGKFGDARFFPFREETIFRTGWERGDAYLAFTCPWSMGHRSVDAGHFHLVAGDEVWSVDYGYAGSPDETQPEAVPAQAGRAHNMILIDRKGQASDRPEDILPGDHPNWPWVAAGANTIQFLDSPGVALVHGNLRSAYTFGLSHYYNRSEKLPYQPVGLAERSVVFVKGAHPYFLVYDDIQKDLEEHDYEWRMHTPPEHSFAVQGPHAVLATRWDQDYLVCESKPEAQEANKPPPLQWIVKPSRPGPHRLWMLSRPDRAYELGQSWRWEPLTPPQQPPRALKEGENPVLVDRSGLRVAAVLATWKDGYVPPVPGSDEETKEAATEKAGDGSVKVFGPDAAKDPALPWTRKGYRAACELWALSPANVTITAKPFVASTLWTQRHKTGGKRSRCVSVSARGVRPHFLVLLYPHRDELRPQEKKAPLPAVEPAAVQGFEKEIRWPDAVDWVGLSRPQPWTPHGSLSGGLRLVRCKAGEDRPVMFLSHFARDLEFKGRKLVAVEGGYPGGAFTVLMAGDTVNLSALVHPDMEYQVRAPARLTLWAPEAKQVLLEGRPVEFARQGEAVVVTVTTRKVRYRVDEIAERIERKAACQLGGTWSFLGLKEETPPASEKPK